MVPDKIYVTTYSVNSAYGNKWGFWTERECPGYAYISKDALLDLLKECKENPVITDLQKGNIQEIIEKIETL